MLEVNSSGDIFQSGCEAVVNPCNTVSVMGAGLALQFKNRYPNMYIDYLNVCKSGGLMPGGLHCYRCQGDEEANGLKWIINFATKAHFKDASRYEWIIKGMSHLRDFILKESIKSVAIPALGCGLGGLDWGVVRDYITVYDKMMFQQFPIHPLKVLLYDPR